MGGDSQHSYGSLHTPPILTGEDSYLEWKEDIKIWELFTDLVNTKRGPAVYLSLKGNARDCVRDLTGDQIGSETDVKQITDKLDNVYLKAGV